MKDSNLASTFNDVENLTLKAYNRFQMGVNLRINYSHAVCVRYWKQFIMEERKHIQQIYEWCSQYSPAEITRKIKDGTLEVV